MLSKDDSFLLCNDLLAAVRQGSQWYSIEGIGVPIEKTKLVLNMMGFCLVTPKSRVEIRTFLGC